MGVGVDWKMERGCWGWRCKIDGHGVGLRSRRHDVSWFAGRKCMDLLLGTMVRVEDLN